MKYALLMVLAVLFPLLGACGSGDSDGAGGSGDSGPAGAYSVDMGPIEAEMNKAIEEMPAEQKAMAEQMMAGLKAEIANAEFKIAADGTFQQAMGSDTSDSGTWTLEGDKITFTTTMRNGEAVNEVQAGTYADGVITVEMAGAGPDPMTMIFRRK